MINRQIFLPPAERVAMLERAGVDHAASFLQQLDYVLVSFLQTQDRQTALKTHFYRIPTKICIQIIHTL